MDTEQEHIDRERLIEVLHSLEHLTQKQVSLKFAFTKGIIYGLGTVIGATVLISIISYIFVIVFGQDASQISSVKDVISN